MRTVLVLFAISIGAGESGDLPDWKTFDDPKAFLIATDFAKSIAALPAVEKAEAVKRLRASLESNESEVRRRAALTLGGLGDKSGVATLIYDLSNVTGHERNNVVVALRILKDAAAIPAFRKALKDKSPYVRGIAVCALGELKATKAFDEIVALTKDKEGLNGKGGMGLNCIPSCPAFYACYALGALGDERAIPVLIELLSDADLRGPTRQALEALTKLPFGDDPAQWKNWWKDKQR